MRRCTGYPEPGRLQRCRESFKLLAYDATSDVGNERRPTWDDRTYRTIGVVAADRVFADTADTSVLNAEVRGLQVSMLKTELFDTAYSTYSPCHVAPLIRLRHTALF